MGISTTTTILKLPEGHCSLFFTSREPRESRSSPSGIPTESFLSIMDQLFEVDLVRASHVCKSWRKAILGCSRLWSVLEDVNIRRFTVVERVRAFASRSKGNLRTISFNFRETDVPLAQLPVATIMRQILRDIARLDGGRSLRTLAMNLLSFQEGDDPLEPAYKCIALAAHFAETSAINLEHFLVESVLPGFSSGAPMWLNLPSIQHLSISCRGDNEGHDIPDYFQTSAETEDLAKISTSQLGRISFVGTRLGEIFYPEFPHLTTLNLSEMTVSNLYGLLSKCAKSLKYLDLREIQSASPSRHMPNPTPNTANVVTKDLPPVLTLSALKKVRICGEDTPLLWGTPTETTVSFTCDTPVLEHADFSSKEHSDPFETEAYDDHGAVDDFTSECVKTLFRRSPQLVAVNFTRTNLNESMLVNGLRESTSCLTYLSIGGTPACNDSTIDRLAALTPQLRVLDVWEPMLEGNRTPSIQALARFAEAMLEVAPSRRVGGNENWSLKIIADGFSLREYISNIDKVLQELKSLLPILSTSQFSYLGSSLEVKPHPTTISSISTTRPILTFASIRNELETFLIPSDEPPFAKPFPPKRGDPGYIKPEEPETDTVSSSEKVNILVAKKQKKKGKKNGPNGRDIAAPIDIVKQAEKLLQEWVEKREIEASLEWFKGQEEKGAGGGGGKVRIEWGSDECGSAGCGEDECACKIWTQDWEEEKFGDGETEEEMEN